MSEILEQINEPDINLVGKKFKQKYGTGTGNIVEVLEDKNYNLKVRSIITASNFSFNIEKRTLLKNYEEIK